jgi:drug/metabolite transporter (DMT)-like permease
MRTIDWLSLVLLSVLWGATFFFVAIALRDIPPFSLVLARVAIAALVLVAIGHLLGSKLRDTLSAWRSFAVLAFFNNLVPFSLIAHGQTRIASGLAAVLNATTPLFTLLVLRVFAGEPLTPAKVGGVLLGIAGVGILMGPEAMAADLASTLGMLCVLGAALSYGVSALCMRRLAGTPPFVSAQAQLVASSLLLLPVAAVADRFWTLPMPGGASIAAVLGLAVVSTGLAYILFFRISAAAGPANVMLVTLLIPLSATALGTLVLGERFAAHQVLGGLVIAAGLLVIDGRLAARLGRRVAAS